MEESIAKDKITLVKRDGRKFFDRNAVVSPGRIFVEDAKLPIERGDHLLRTLPDGRQESYRVINPGYCPAIAGFQAHFQVQVEPEDLAAPEPAGASAPGAGMAGPVDLQRLTAKELFARLRQLAFENFSQSDHAKAFLAIDDMEQNFGAPGFANAYKQFIAVCAAYMRLLADYLPVITKFL